MTPVKCCDESVAARRGKQVSYGKGGVIRTFKRAFKEGKALHYEFGSGVVCVASQSASR